MVVRFIVFLLIILSVELGYGLTTDSLIKRINNFFKNIHSYNGDFELHDGKSLSKGYFMFKQPHFFKMVFAKKGSDEEKVKRIISNGTTLWIYYPKSPFGQIVIEQDLKSALESSITIPAKSLGIRRLIRDYNIQFENNNADLRSVDKLADKVYILELNGKNKNYGFKKLFFYVRQDGFIVKTVAMAYDKGNRKFIFIRKNVVLNNKIADKEFTRKVPKDAKVIRNPFVSGRGY